MICQYILCGYSEIKELEIQFKERVKYLTD